MGPGRRRHGERRHFQSRSGTAWRYRVCRSAGGRRKVSKGQEAAVVESVKAASDVYAPVSGEVVEGNAALADDPAVINRDPEGDGWFFKLRHDDTGELDGLMDEGAYREWVKTL